MAGLKDAFDEGTQRIIEELGVKSSDSVPVVVNKLVNEIVRLRDVIIMYEGGRYYSPHLVEEIRKWTLSKQ